MTSTVTGKRFFEDSDEKSSRKEMRFLSDPCVLPNDMFELVINFLPEEEILQASLVSKKWKELLAEANCRFRALFAKHFPIQYKIASYFNLNWQESYSKQVHITKNIRSMKYRETTKQIGPSLSVLRIKPPSVNNLENKTVRIQFDKVAKELTIHLKNGVDNEIKIKANSFRSLLRLGEDHFFSCEGTEIKKWDFQGKCIATYNTLFSETYQLHLIDHYLITDGPLGIRIIDSNTCMTIFTAAGMQFNRMQFGELILSCKKDPSITKIFDFS